ncbi:MAG: tRNA preQ1(34) S-adenosylmethionine ribosyltransferase-isomerase QueA [Anaerolineae bacterium]|nr:tRNA preQ1(34) S-adenosylmethionine ribosyltransferase-isomerase QueA [Anaerolineae bacterium]
MKTADFDYELPARLIAQTPIEPRDASRLMVVTRADQSITHASFRDLGAYLRPGDLLVCNNTRVIRARLLGKKVPSGGKVELLLTVKRDDTCWEALTRGRRVPVGGLVEFAGNSGEAGEVILRAEVGERIPSGGRLVRFKQPVEPFLRRLGSIPLPPYIHKDLDDPERYQTIYAENEGSAAAPTAGLHFTPDLMSSLRRNGIDFSFLTLHVGTDTFLPIREERLEEHPMHSEYCAVPATTVEAINRAKAVGQRVVAVGTTVVRALESAAQGLARDELQALARYEGWTDLFIYPGFRFGVVDCLLTNFHLPRSTLLLLVAAFAGKELLEKAYRQAIEREYRFYSFGDAMLIL